VKQNSMLMAGNLGHDVEVRYTPSGKAVADISIALDQGFGDNKSTVWTKLTVWEETAERLTDAQKGDNIIAINVEYRTETYKNKDDVEVTKHYFHAGKFSRVAIIQKSVAVREQDPAEDLASEHDGDGCPF